MGCCESRNAGQPIPAERPLPKRQRDAKDAEAKGDYGEWPWSRPSPEDRKTFKKQTVDFYYTKEYLQSFKILNAVEAKAYEAYLNNDLDQARSILDNRGVLATPVVSPLSPATDMAELFDTRTEQIERTRGGSVAAAVPDTKQAVGNMVPSSPRTAEDEALIQSAIRRCPLFTHLSSNFKEHTVVSQHMVRKEFAPGSSIFVSGEYPSDEVRAWYVVITGKVHIKRRKVKELRMPGDFFGEMLVTNATCKSNIDVKASDSQRVVTYALDHHSYSRVLSSIAHQRREKYKNELRKVCVGERRPFAELREGQLAQLADCLTERSYKPGDTIIKYGEPGRFAHIIMKGKVTVIGRKDGQPFKVCEFSEGEDPLGFLEFFSAEEEPTIADVVASADCNTITACINKEHFEKCIGSVKDVFKQAADTEAVYGYYRDVKGTKN